MSCFYQMDISGLGLSEDVYTGIRTLSYDRSCKVAIAFNHPWWDNYSATADGGTSSTDLPIRTVVYPNRNDGGQSPAVLFASYKWAQDASRMGAVINNSSTPVKNLSDPLIQLVLSNLAKLWSSVQDGPSLQDLQIGTLSTTPGPGQTTQKPLAGRSLSLGPGNFPKCNHYSNRGLATTISSCVVKLSAHIMHGFLGLSIAQVQRCCLLAAKSCTDAMVVLKASPWAGAPGQVPDGVEENVLWTKVRLGENRE